MVKKKPVPIPLGGKKHTQLVDTVMALDLFTKNATLEKKLEELTQKNRELTRRAEKAEEWRKHFDGSLSVKRKELKERYDREHKALQDERDTFERKSDNWKQKMKSSIEWQKMKEVLERLLKAMNEVYPSVEEIARELFSEMNYCEDCTRNW